MGSIERIQVIRSVQKYQRGENTMKAFMVYEPFNYKVTDMPVPAIKDDEVLVKVGASSICHSDLDIIEGLRKHAIKLPVITGHEFAGTVAETGKCVENINIGDKVVCECIVWCGTCRHCRLGLTSMCLNFCELGTMRNGGYAEYAAVPARMVHRFDKISMNEASNTEPAGNAFHAVEEANIISGDRVVVIGPGPIGLYALQIARLKNPEMLIMVGTRDDRLQLSKKLGATHIINSRKEDAVEAVMELTGGRGADKILQCATTDAALQLAVQTAGMNSKIVIEGFCGTGRGVEFDFNDFIKKPMAIAGVSGVFSRHFKEVLELMELGRIDAKPVISHTIPLANIIDGMNLLKSKQDGIVKIVVNP